MIVSGTSQPSRMSAAHPIAGVKRIMEELGGDPNLCNAKGLPPVYEACENVDGSSNKDDRWGMWVWWLVIVGGKP